MADLVTDRELDFALRLGLSMVCGLFTFISLFGMAIGFGWFVIAGVCALYSVVVPRIPHFSTWGRDNDP